MREMVGPRGLGTLSPEAMDEAFAYIAKHPEIWEVILTAGEPLMLSPRRLGEIMQRLDAIDHVKIVRFHTRVPVVEPERINEALITAMKASGKTAYTALHANHPRAGGLRGRGERRSGELEDPWQILAGHGRRDRTGAKGAAGGRHHDAHGSQGQPEDARTMSLPLTAKGRVSRIYTDMAVFDITAEGLHLREIAEGVGLAELRAATGAPCRIPDHDLPRF